LVRNRLSWKALSPPPNRLHFVFALAAGELEWAAAREVDCGDGLLDHARAEALGLFAHVGGEFGPLQAIREAWEVFDLGRRGDLTAEGRSDEHEWIEK